MSCEVLRFIEWAGLRVRSFEPYPGVQLSFEIHPRVNNARSHKQRNSYRLRHMVLLVHMGFSGFRPETYWWVDRIVHIAPRVPPG